MSTNSRPAAFASASTRGPSRRARPGSRRWARRRSRRTTSVSGLLTSWSEVGRGTASRDSRVAIRLLKGFLGNLHQPGKGTAVAHGQVSQHLAVDLHTGLAKAVHQLVVGQPRLPRGGVDARDPQLPHLSLAAAAVAKRVSERMQDRLIGWAKQQLLREPETFGAVEDRLVATVRRDSTLDACHLDTQGSPDCLAVSLVDGLLVAEFALALLGLVLQQVTLPGPSPHELSGRGHAHTLGDALARLELRHWWRSPSRRLPSCLEPGS